MKNNYTCATTYSASAIFAFMLIVCFGLTFQVNAQTFYRTVSASQLNTTVLSSIEPTKDIKSEGAYLIKDGQLDEIYNLKLILPTSKLDSVIKDKKITFEQTRVMVLPIMGMVHFVGTLDVNGVKSTTDFQLGFRINNDHTITFKGNKLFILNDLDEKLPKNELKLDIDFVLKNNNDLVVLNAK